MKAIACELPREHGLPLSRFSRAELHRLVVERALTDASASTIARWLREDALKPCQHRSWVFPTDPAFLENAGPRSTSTRAGGKGGFSTPATTSSAPMRSPRSRPGRAATKRCPRPRVRAGSESSTYERRGALTYLAALDIKRAKVFGRSEARGGIEPFDRLVWQVMTKEPYASSRDREGTCGREHSRD